MPPERERERLKGSAAVRGEVESGLVETLIEEDDEVPAKKRRTRVRNRFCEKPEDEPAGGAFKTDGRTGERRSGFCKGDLQLESGPTRSAQRSRPLLIRQSMARKRETLQIGVGTRRRRRRPLCRALSRAATDRRSSGKSSAAPLTSIRDVAFLLFLLFSASEPGFRSPLNVPRIVWHSDDRLVVNVILSEVVRSPFPRHDVDPIDPDASALLAGYFRQPVPRETKGLFFLCLSTPPNLLLSNELLFPSPPPPLFRLSPDLARLRFPERLILTVSAVTAAAASFSHLPCLFVTRPYPLEQPLQQPRWFPLLLLHHQH